MGAKISKFPRTNKYKCRLTCIFADFETNFADFETRFAYFESQFPKICSRLFNEFKVLKSNERSQYGSPGQAG